MEHYRIPASRRSTGFPLVGIVVAALAAMLLVRWGASLLIDYEWWKEIGQVNTWIDYYSYQTVPLAIGVILAAVVLWLAHGRAVKFAGIHLQEHRLYSKLATLGAVVLGWLIAAANIDNWTIMRYIGSRSLPAGANAWHDPVFNQPLHFYLFDLPFYESLRVYVLALTIASIVVYWLAARGWQLRYQLPDFNPQQIDLRFLRLSGGLESKYLRGAAVVFLLAMAVKYYLGRYAMVWNDHGFMTGIDYTDAKVGLPLQWLLILAAIAAAVLVLLNRWIAAAAMVLALPIAGIVPAIFSSIYVKPNEISLESPYIGSHIEATRSAYGLESRVKVIDFQTAPEATLDESKHKVLLDNVRLWDWKPFHDTVSQTQALRPYYVFSDTDVDRYMIDGRPRQVLLSPRELDINQLPSGASSSWVNRHFTYTHGYGLVLAEVSKIGPDGLPSYLIDNMPLEIRTPSLKVTRPELYFSETQADKVFVHTAQEEAPAADQQSHYEGTGGCPMSSMLMRLAAAIEQGDANILLTSYLTPNSRMMIRRKLRDRLDTMAGFLLWDGDPYLVITKEGRLVWMIDGYTTSDSHPYSRREDLGDFGPINYMRNAVKATVDAYDGTTHLYVFAPDDPIIQAYKNLFPSLFLASSEMPADLRAHARYPELLFNVQAELYRTYHMTNPQAFYNKEDLWDLSSFVSGQGEKAQQVRPTYLDATLPGESQPEFVLLTSYTPRNKQNMISVMIARCDGDHLGEINVLKLSKQKMTLGPMMISARIDQDQVISKDLTMWNQQGSQVLRGQVLVLPIDNTFLYVEPIYLQAAQARIPQLQKVVLALGDRIVYEDTYEKALAQLSGGPAPVSTGTTSTTTISGAPPPPPPGGANGLQSVREHLRRYRELAGQGRFAEAGKELEAAEAAAK
ncbi:MAG TPA: UPF0182 family protein [Bryobacteraceae bacterium]